MASVTTVTYTDDISGRPADETVRFALDGAQYEIDLAGTNAEALRKALSPFVEHARKVPVSVLGRPSGHRRQQRAGGGMRSDKAELLAIRTWAAKNGVPVAAKGRISAQVREQYAAR